MLIGLEIAQRVSDLLSLTEQNIQFITDLDNNLTKCLIFKQKKSQYTKEIVIPIDERFSLLLSKGFPYKISDQKFNEYLKELCRLAKIDGTVEGSIVVLKKVEGKQQKRMVKGMYPKWKLISSHSLRRTAATHYYQQFGSKVKLLTGHSKEETLNIYINQDRSRKLTEISNMRKHFTLE